MAKGKAALAFAAGFGKGYLDTRSRKRDEARQDERDAREKERYDSEKEERERRRADDVALRNAGTPAAVKQANDVQMDDDGNTMPAAPQHEVSLAGTNGQRFSTAQEAQAVAEKHNSPEAMSNRVATTLQSQGKFGEALQHRQAAEKYGQERFRRRLGEAMGSGFGGIESFINETEAGPFKGKQVKFVPSQDGKTMTLHTVGPDGQPVPTSLQFPNDEKGPMMAGYMLDQSITPEVRYKLMIEQDRREADAKRREREFDLRERTFNEVTKPLAEVRGQAALAQAEAAGARAEASLARARNADTNGDGKVSREERLRYTTLFTDAGRRMQDAQKAMNTMRGDRSFMRRAAQDPNSAEGRQLAEVQQQLREHQEERELYRGLLSPATGKAKGKDEGGLADVPPKAGGQKPAKAAPGEPPKVSTKAERDKLPKGTRYIGPDGQTYIKQ